MIYVVGGNYRQARDWIRGQTYLNSECRAVMRPEDLCGVGLDAEFIMVGTWRDRKDIADISRSIDLILSMSNSKKEK